MNENMKAIAQDTNDLAHLSCLQLAQLKSQCNRNNDLRQTIVDECNKRAKRWDQVAFISLCVILGCILLICLTKLLSPA